MKHLSLLLPCALLALPSPPAQAHPGGLNAEGCHNNRQSGGYHCHRNRRSSPQAPTAQLRGGSISPIAMRPAPHAPRRSCADSRAIAPRSTATMTESPANPIAGDRACRGGDRAVEEPQIILASDLQ